MNQLVGEPDFIKVDVLRIRGVPSEIVHIQLRFCLNLGTKYKTMDLTWDIKWFHWYRETFQLPGALTVDGSARLVQWSKLQQLHSVECLAFA